LKNKESGERPASSTSENKDKTKSMHQRLLSAKDLKKENNKFNNVDEASIEQEESDERFYVSKNVVTKYAFATRVGYIPMNPNKVNQDTYILGPCIEGPENNSKHIFGVNDGHG